MLNSKLAKRAGWLLAAATVATYFFKLGAVSFIGADEPRYAQVAREMYERGDWVTPTLGGQTWFEKPALVYWTEIASFQLFGVSEWSARLGILLSGLLTIALVGWLARRVERACGDEARGLGLACAGVSASSAGLIVFSRAVNFDVMIMLTITLALSCFLLAEIEAAEGRRRWLLRGFYAGMGLSLLAKGLIGVVLPIGVVGLYFLPRRKLPNVWRLAPWGLLLAAAVAALWYGPVTWRHGWKFVDEFIIQHHFARYTSNKYKHPQPVYFYLPILLLLVLPWTAYLVAAVWRAARRWDWRADDATTRFRLFALAWMIVPIGFFSLSGSKLPGYILPALPGAALLVGDELARYVRGEASAKAMRATGVLVLTLGVAGLGYAFATGAVGKACALLVAAPAFIAGAVALWRAEQRTLAATSIVGASLLTAFLIGVCVLESAARRETVRELLRAADARGYGDAPVVNLHTIERTSEFYAAERLTYEGSNPAKYEGVWQVARDARQSSGPVLVIVPLEHLPQLTGYDLLEAEVIGDNGELALVAARTR
ncbi:MAG: ArnT family glycosyltransferase [Pyrinomonadaceae bacterium]